MQLEDGVMTRIAKFVLLGAAVLGAATLVYAQQQQESLADYARRVTANQPPKPPDQKVYTNDDLQFHTVPQTTTTTTTTDSTDSTKPKTTKKNEPQPKSDDDLKKEKQAAWDTKFKDQHKEIDTLTRELDVLVREQKLRDATFYADVGGRLQHEAEYAQASEKYKTDIAAKTQALADSKQKLEDMREEARKDGCQDNTQ
jgi:hypothetical protein